MSITSYKITDSDISSKGVVAAPTVLSGSPEENKKVFDRLVREVLKGDFNALVDALAATTGAGEIGAAVEGLTGETVQAVLIALKTMLDSKAASADMEAALGGKSETSVTDAHFKSVAFDAGTGVFTFTKENGTTVTVDTALEKVAVNFAYDEDTQSLVLTLADGSTQRVSLASFLTTTEFEDSNTIEWSVSGSTVRATIKSGSITDAMLSSTLKTMLQGYVSAAANSATNAAASETASLSYRAEAQEAAAAAAESRDQAASSQTAAAGSAAAAKSAADRAASASAHQPRISSDGYWELWDLTQGVYVKTTYQANGADGDPGIVISATQPTAESHPVWINPEGEASPAGGTDLSLGITGATVGQIAKITAVDDSGKPTAWEAVDMPSGGGDTLLYHYDTSEDAIITSTALVPNLDISTTTLLLFKWHINGYGTEFGGRLMINNQPLTKYFPYLHRKAGDTVDIFCVVAVSDVSLTVIKFIVDSNYFTDSADFVYGNGGTSDTINVINTPNSGTIESFGIEGATVTGSVPGSPQDTGEYLDYTTSGFSVDVYKVV